MMNSIQNAVIRIILNPLAHKMNRFTKKAKDVLFIACMVIIIIIQFMYSSGLLTCRYLYIYAAGCVLVGGMILAGLEKENLKCVNFNKALLLSWLGIGVCALISGVLNSVDYLTDAVLYLVVFPIFFIVWCNAAFSRLAKLLITSVKISFVVCTLILFVRYPIGAFHYAGFFLNPNGAALYFSAAFVCMMQSVFIKDTTVFQKVSNYCLLGLAFALVFYTNSRGGLLSVICSYSFTTILYVYIHRKNLKCTLMKAVLLPIVAISLFICITPHLLNAGNRIVEQVTQNSVEKKEPISSVSLNDQLGYLEEKFGKNDRRRQRNPSL